MQTNPYPIVAIDIELESEPNTCACSHSNGRKVCTDCNCHLPRENNYIIMPIPPPRIQFIGYGIIIATVTCVALYMLTL
jgi:hypothetical protein